MFAGNSRKMCTCAPVFKQHLQLSGSWTYRFPCEVFSRMLWVCGHGQQRVFPWLLWERWFHLTSKGYCYPDPVSAALLQRSRDYNATFLQLNVCRVWENITANPNPFLCMEMFSCQVKPEKGWGFQVVGGTEQKRKWGRSKLSHDRKQMLLHIAGKNVLAEQCRWLHSLPGLSHQVFITLHKLVSLRYQFCLGICLHWLSNCVWVRPGVYSWAIFGSH